jgi:phage gp36-like protein
MPPVTIYATKDDLGSAINPSALSGLGPAAQDRALTDASAEADGYLRNQFTLPLTAVNDPALRRHVANMAIYQLMVARGYNPEAEGDGIRQRYTDAIAWLKGVGAGTITPSITDSASGSSSGVSAGAAPMVISSPLRGFTSRGDPNGRSGPFQGS